MGSNKRMHTVIEKYCTGCALCLPVCPVDCIEMENVSDHATGWSAWSEALALQARSRYTAKQQRVQRATHAQLTDPAVLERKRSIIETALARAKARKPVVEASSSTAVKSS